VRILQMWNSRTLNPLVATLKMVWGGSRTVAGFKTHGRSSRHAFLGELGLRCVKMYISYVFCVKMYFRNITEVHVILPNVILNCRLAPCLPVRRVLLAPTGVQSTGCRDATSLHRGGSIACHYPVTWPSNLSINRPPVDLGDLPSRPQVELEQRVVSRGLHSSTAQLNLCRHGQRDVGL